MISDRLKTAGKVTVSALALAYLAVTVPLAEAVSGIFTIPGPYVVGLVLTWLATLATSALGLHVLVRHYRAVPFVTSVRIYLLNLFANSFIPSRAGSMVSMPLLLKRYGDLDSDEGVAVQGTNLLIVALLIAAAALVGLARYFREIAPSALVLVSAGIAVYVGFVVVVLAFRSGLDAYLPSFLPAFDLVVNRRTLYATAVLVVSTLLLVGVRFALVARGLGLELGLLAYVLVPTLAYTVNVLPISLSGLGVAEVTAVTVLVSLGVPAELATTVILVDRAVGVYLPVSASGLYTAVHPYLPVPTT